MTASHLHEFLVDLFRSRPTLAAELITIGLGFDMPPYAEVRIITWARLGICTAYHRLASAGRLEDPTDIQRRHIPQWLELGPGRNVSRCVVLALFRERLHGLR